MLVSDIEYKIGVHIRVTKPAGLSNAQLCSETSAVPR